MSRQLQINSFDNVYECEIIKRHSQHDYVYIKASLTNEQAGDWEKLKSEPVKVDIVNDSLDRKSDKIESNVFLGDIDELNIEYNMGWYAEIKAYSYSKSMDIDRKIRIFQSTDKTLYSIIKDVCKEYKGIVLKDIGIDEISIPSPVMQYKETDWEFINRLVREFGLELVYSQDDSQVHSGTIWIGKIERSSTEVSDEVVVGKMYHDNIFYYTFYSTEVYELGDCIMYNGNEYFIVESKMILKDCYFYKQYIFTDVVQKERETSFDNVELMAEVIALEGDGRSKGQIQVKFDIEEEIASKPVWIDWVTSYSSSETGIYNMPVIGEKVIVHLLEGNQVNWYASGNIRNVDIDEQLTVKDKLFRLDDKEIYVSEDFISVKNSNVNVRIEKNNITISYEDNKWVLGEEGLKVVVADKKVVVNGKSVNVTGDDISVSGKKVSVKADKININGKVSVT